ncbi:hypothetical protein [Shivajiella indica]|uniref:Uncharacterized protein n=1 Tax=Shivajiella indica TaxID=872115 RepID=A0ABW5BBQ9_9BACT
MFKKFILFLIFICFSGGLTFSQTTKTRIQPGKLYQEGESLYAPTYGFQASVPNGWMGNLPRESEVFLLMSSIPGQFGEVFVFGREKIDLNVLAEKWKKGENVSETVRLKAISPSIKDDLLSSEVVAEGNYVNPNYKGFAATRCGNNGYCITVLAISSEESFLEVNKTAIDLLKSAKFEEPSNASPYENFDWKAFLSNKLMISYIEMRQGQKQTQVNLCENGTFTANVRKKGIMKEVNPQYRGNMKGSWSIEGSGEIAVMVLNFQGKKLAPLRINLKIEDEQIFANEERYYASESVKCK